MHGLGIFETIFNDERRTSLEEHKEINNILLTDIANNNNNKEP